MIPNGKGRGEFSTSVMGLTTISLPDGAAGQKRCIKTPPFFIHFFSGGGLTINTFDQGRTGSFNSTGAREGVFLFFHSLSHIHIIKDTDGAKAVATGLGMREIGFTMNEKGFPS